MIEKFTKKWLKIWKNPIPNFQNFILTFLLQGISIGLLVYRLSDTEERGPEFYEKDKGSAQIHGQIFEYKFCALSYLRARNKGHKFKLASNVKGLGAFDDVAVEYLDGNCRIKHIFLQLKSKLNQSITMQQLLAEKGNFSLRKYYESYIQVEKKFSCKIGRASCRERV